MKKTEKKSTRLRRNSAPVSTGFSKSEESKRREIGTNSQNRKAGTIRRYSAADASVRVALPSSIESKLDRFDDESHSSHSLLSSPAWSETEADCLALKLPPEVMVRIFAYFPVEDLGTRIGPVCRYWFSVSRDPILWREIYIRRQCSLNGAIGLLSYARTAEVVHISNYRDIDELLVSSAILDNSGATLRCLDLGFCEMGIEAFQYAFLTAMPRLVHLNLEGIRIIDLSAIITICSACCSGTLERINLSHCVNICDESVETLCRHQTRLTHVNLDGVEWISDVGVNQLITHLRNQLEAVWLDGASLTNSAVNQLASCPNLHLLSIRFCETLSNVLPLRSMQSLRSLTLRKASQVTAQHIMELFSLSDSKLTDLVYLDLSECSVVSDLVAEALCKLCGASLRHLILDWCWEITDVGLCDIATKCVKLRRLSLTGLHNLTGSPLQLYPEVMPQLFILNLANCNRIQDDLIQRLVDENPSLIAFNYYGDRFETEGNIHPELSTDHDLWRLPNTEYTRVCTC